MSKINGKVEQTYPFAPKSNQKLSVGDFWAVPLQDGSFGCGRVLQLPPPELSKSRVSFFAGLMDWRGFVFPTAEHLKGSQTIAQGSVHILTVTTTGGAILGNRPLELDQIEPWLFDSGRCQITKGYVPLRRWQSKDEGQFLAKSTWGYGVMTILANKYLLNLDEN